MRHREELLPGQIDTDSPEIREERVKAEEDIYSKISELFRDKSLIERTTEVREHIFRGYNNVKGDPITRIREDEVRAGSFRFIPPIEMAQKYFPALVKRIDKLYDHVLEDTDITEGEKLDRLLRFSAVVYSLGITLHPYVDGNGQTFRLTALSYLSEIFDKRFTLPKNTKIEKTAPTELINIPLGWPHKVFLII